MWVFLLVLLIAAAIIEFISMRQGTRYLTGDYRAVPDRIEPGEELKLAFQISNSGSLPVSHAEIEVSTPIGRFSESFALRGHRRKTAFQTLSAEKRGVYQMKTAHLKRGDFLGVKESSVSLNCLREFLVYPEAKEYPQLEEYLLRFTGDMIASHCLERDPILTMGLRDYTGQEPMKTISWSASARRGGIMVREFEYTGQISCCLLMMTSGIRHDEHALLDTMASLSRGICSSIIAQGFDLSFYTNAHLVGLPGRYASCRPSVEDMGGLLEILARADELTGCGGDTLADAALRALGDDCSFILLAAHEDKHSAACLEKLRSHARGPVMFINARDYLPEEEA